MFANRRRVFLFFNEVNTQRLRRRPLTCYDEGLELPNRCTVANLFNKTSDKVKPRLTTIVCFFPGISGWSEVLLTTIIVTHCAVVWVLLSMFSIVWMTSFGDSPSTLAWPLLYRLFWTKAGRVVSMRGYWRRVRCSSRKRRIEDGWGRDDLTVW